ncbi:MAG: universal stress protein [Gaiellales bacterium]
MATIVVGVDGGRAARRTLERVAVLAGDDDNVVVVGAIEPAWTGNGFRVDPFEVEERERSLDEARRTLFRLGVGARAVLARGRESTVLSVVAEQSGARLIVAGPPRRLTQRIRLALGSARLERLAPCPVVRVM